MVSHNEKRAEKNLIASNGDGDPLVLIETRDELEEADAIISALEKEIKLHKRNFSHFSIFVRKHHGFLSRI